MGFTSIRDSIFIYACSSSREALDQWAERFDQKAEKKGIEYTGPYRYPQESVGGKTYRRLHFKVALSDRAKELIKFDPPEELHFKMSPESLPNLSSEDMIPDSETPPVDKSSSDLVGSGPISPKGQHSEYNHGGDDSGQSKNTCSSQAQPSTDSPTTSQNEQLGKLREQAEESAVEEVPESATTSRQTKQQYSRSEKVRDYVMARADGECEGCGEPAPFTSTTGKPYLHAHHIHELSDGGSDTPDTVVALCPNCHYQVHHGEDGEEYNQELLEMVQEIEAS